MQYMHKNGYMHRDLKPENILLSDRDSIHPIIKIADLGLAKAMDRYNAHASEGVTSYVR